MNRIFHREYNYNEVYLKPNKCIVNSRSDCDITATLGRFTFRNPVIAANMASVVDYNTCRYLGSKGMFYIMHRFHLNELELFEFIEESTKEYGFASVSVGIQEEDKRLIENMRHVGCMPYFITIDVAHAHSDRVLDMAKFIKDQIPDTYLIVGNVATAEGVEFLQSIPYHVSAIKIGIGPGKSCITRCKTGFTRGMITCVNECSGVSDVAIIADGGIREWGDISKAIVCGADMVMIGSLMAGFSQSPGDVVEIDGHKKYIYYGSASFNNTQSKRHVEGKEIILDYKGDMEDVIYDIECSLRSACSYAGVKRIEEMYNLVDLFYME